MRFIHHLEVSMNRLIIPVFLLIALASPLSACDTNLLNLVTGRTPADDFTRLIVTMASQTQDIGQHVSDANVAQQHLDFLMKSWIEFDNRFSRKPPAWAVNDPEWTGKIKSMADLIGAIKKGLAEQKQPDVHVNVTCLHRRLISLFAAQPLDPLKKRLMRLNELFGRLSQTLQGDVAVTPSELVGSISTDLKELPAQIPTQVHPSLVPLALEVEDLVRELGKGGKPTDLAVRLSILKAEDLFKEFNGALNMADAAK